MKARQMSILAAGALVWGGTGGVEAGHRETQVSIEAHYGALAPHGTWSHHAEYGQVWQPHEVHRHTGWEPYRHGGCWVRSSAGVRWRSYHPWGAVTFSFGRWVHGAGCGWVWVPGPACAPPVYGYRGGHRSHGHSSVSFYYSSGYRAPRCAPPPPVYHHRPPVHHRPPSRGCATTYAAPRHAAPRHAPARHTPAPRVVHPTPQASSRSTQLHALVRGRFGR